MGFSLPSLGTPAREAMGDIAHIAEILNPARVSELLSFPNAIRAAKEAFAFAPGIKKVNIVCLRANDECWLISVGPRGGWKLVWNFGNGRN